MNKDLKPHYCMTEDELKSLKKSIEYVKKLDFFNKNDKTNSKEIRKVA